MTSIPGLPGESDPSFRTGDRGWMRLDDLVLEAVAWLDADGVELSPYVVKATVQLTRHMLDCNSDWGEGGELFLAVHEQLRRAGVLLQAHHVQRIVRVYASVVALLDIRDVLELGA